jgi:hypothetical protein
MTETREPALHRLLLSATTQRQLEALLDTVEVAPALAAEHGGMASRAVIAQALNLLLIEDLLARVPSGQQYAEECRANGRKIVFDHGALRTVAFAGMGDLPSGHEAIGRILAPLGYEVAALYPLEKLKMTGRAYTHVDYPEDLPQFFVSELHTERFSSEFQAVVARVTSTSRDPLTPVHQDLLKELSVRRALPMEKARQLIPALMYCFRRHHSAPLLSDYEMLLTESKEMAWIATEGNAFNHATDRVQHLDSLVDDLRRREKPLKDKIEVSGSGRVRQTAFHADKVEREFVNTHGNPITRLVPGSFFEFIERATVRDEARGGTRMDLAFDSSNAQGIFKMTAAA